MKSFIAKKTIATLALVSILGPGLTFAQSTTGAASSVSPAAFCLNINVIANQVYSVMLAAQATYHADRNQRALDAGYTNNQALQNKGMADAYAQSLNAKVFSSLSARAKTQEQKDALAAFQSTYNSASAAMKSANTQAISDYKSASVKIHTARTAAINDAIMAYTNSVNSAIAKAKTDCASGTDSASAYTTFTTSIKAANAAFAAGSKMSDIKTQLQALNQTLAASLKASAAAYKAAVKPAWATLMAAFKLPVTTDAPATN